MLIGWILIFLTSLVVLIKGADWFLESTEKIGFKIGLSSFVIGVIIVGIGTSLPELISSLFAAFKDSPEIIAANAIGSNIANILLVVGFSAVIGKKLQVSKDLVDLELPLLAASTAVFGLIAWDRVITFPEALILVAGCVLYLAYIITTPDDDGIDVKKEPAGLAIKEAAKHKGIKNGKKKGQAITGNDIIVLLVGVAGLVFGAQYLIESVIQISTLLNLATGVITITAVAIGTSLPELLVSSKAALSGRSEVALGNIFGSNAFNILLVVGIPGLFTRINLDEPTFIIGLPFLIIATFLFIISGVSRKIHNWEGGFYLMLYLLFAAQLFNLF